MRAIPTLACVLVLLASLPAAASHPPKVDVGTPAPVFELRTPDGTAISLEALRGRVVVLNFWASWCGPCLKELPSLDALHDRLQPDGGLVLALNVDVQEAPALGVLRKLKLDLPVALDPDQRTVAAYDPSAMPTTYVIGPDGVVASVRRGGIEEEEIAAFEAEVRRLLPHE